MPYQNYGKQKQLKKQIFLKHIHTWGEEEKMHTYIYTYGKEESNLSTWVINYQKTISVAKQKNNGRRQTGIN